MVDSKKTDYYLNFCIHKKFGQTIQNYSEYERFKKDEPTGKIYNISIGSKDIHKNRIISTFCPFLYNQSTNIIDDVLGIFTGIFKNNLNSLFNSTSKSRFSFAKPNFEGHEINQIIPSQINDFITQQFIKHSKFFNEEQNRFSDYYISLKPNSLDSDESWSSLVSTFKKWNDVYENEENETFNKFNTY